MPDTEKSTAQIEPPKKKPLWPWIVVLLITVLSIYAFNRANEVFDDIMANLPDAVLSLFEDMLEQSHPPGLKRPSGDDTRPLIEIRDIRAEF
jgi:hypothetical protein